MKSIMGHKFSEVPTIDIPRSTFDRSHGYKTTFDAGKLIPIFFDQQYPGDTAAVNVTGFCRLSTPIYPIMDNMILETFFFGVPNRLLWTNFKKFMGEQIDPGDSIDYTIPQVADLNNESEHSIWDYFGLPTKVAADYDVNAFIPRAMNQIYNEWFRDQNLIDSVPKNIDDGPDTKTDYEVLNVCKRHDYFTSALPWLQKGDSVQLSLGTEAPITGIGYLPGTWSTGPVNVRETDATGTTPYANYDQNNITIQEDPSNAGYPNMRADLINATASTVNELRQAIQVQRLLERDARSGTRYIESVKAHFGVNSADSRQQRPEYLGGGKTPIVFQPVPRTDSSPGELGAYATGLFSGHGFTKSFTEHTIIIGFATVRADLTYQEGIERMWSDQTRYDMYYPVLSHLGEQAVLNKEIYVDAADLGAGTTEEVFGYQEAWAHLRYKPSRITGLFRSNATGSLDAWHLGIEFGATPTLDDTFIVENPPIDRIIATPTEPHFKLDTRIGFINTRPMPTYSVPGLIDHF